MYTEDSIMTYENFNNIESKIVELNNILTTLGYTVDTYTPKNWVKKDFLIYAYLNNIEEGIQALANGYYKPYGWREIKEWTKGMSFSYNDVNRWLIDLDLMKKEIQKHPETTIWNGQSFENWNSYDTGLEWEE